MRDPEIDQTCYPYGSLRIGDNTFIANIPTLTKVYQHPVPLEVALHAAARLNAMYHSGKAVATLANIVASPERLFTLVRDEAHACRSRGLIDNAQYLAIQLQEA